MGVEIFKESKMDYQIKNMKATHIIGVTRQFKSGGHAQSNIPDFWEDVTSMGLDRRLAEKVIKHLMDCLASVYHSKMAK